MDVNKADDDNTNIRSRLVGWGLKAKTKESLLAHELFSAMPPWGIINILLGLLATDGIPGPIDFKIETIFSEGDRDDSGGNDDELMLGIYDILRAHFSPHVKRELYIEIPKGDLSDQDGDVVGKSNRNMSGFRDAANGWFEDWQELLGIRNYTTGIANPTLFYNAQRGSRGAAHGDDFYVLGRQRGLDDMTTLPKSKYSVRETHP